MTDRQLLDLLAEYRKECDQDFATSPKALWLRGRIDEAWRKLSAEKQAELAETSNLENEHDGTRIVRRGNYYFPEVKDAYPSTAID